MKRILTAVVIGVAALAAGTACKIEHNRTVTEEQGGGETTEHSVKLKETVSGKEKGVELYKFTDEETQEELEREKAEKK